jgi:hypothetical protein
MENLKQTKKVGNAGSFINQMMGNNASAPIVGEWATLMHYTDRSVAKVVEVSEDGKTAKLQNYEAKAGAKEGGHGMGHQNWVFDAIEGSIETLVWLRGAWRTPINEIVFTKEYLDNCPTFSPARSLTKEQLDEIYDGDIWPRKVVEGITRAKKSHSKPVSILFGTCDYYYDWSF